MVNADSIPVRALSIHCSIEFLSCFELLGQPKT